MCLSEDKQSAIQVTLSYRLKNEACPNQLMSACATEPWLFATAAFMHIERVNLVWGLTDKRMAPATK